MPGTPPVNGTITLKDIGGVARRPLDVHGGKAVTLFFIAHDCPISNAYAPEIGRICQEYIARKVACYVVYVDPRLPASVARQHAAAYRFPCPCLLDPEGVLVRRAGATVTPEVAVLDPQGRCRYRGRIDDLWADFGKRRAKPTHLDLRLALDAILTGKPVPQPSTRAIGCFIPSSDKDVNNSNKNKS